MKRVCILTATRAEYSLLKPLMVGLLGDSFYDTRIAVTGMHLSPEFGMTVNEIVSDGIPIDKKIEIVLSSDTPIALSKAMGLAMISFCEYFENITKYEITCEQSASNITNYGIYSVFSFLFDNYF